MSYRTFFLLLGTASFAVASLLTSLALVTLLVKRLVGGKIQPGRQPAQVDEGIGREAA